MAYLEDQEDTILLEDVNVFTDEVVRKPELVDSFAKIGIDSLGRKDKRKAKALVKKFEGNGARSKQIDVESISGYFLWGLVPPPYNLDSLIDLADRNDTHWACIQFKVANIVGLGYRWSETSKILEAKMNVADSEKEMKLLSRKLRRTVAGINHWVDGLNDDDSLSDILTKAWLDVESCGNGYIEVGRNNGGTIGYLGHIPASSIRVRANRDGFVQVVGTDRVFFRNFGDTETADIFGESASPNEIIHLKKHSPKSSYYGVPDIVAAMPSIAGDKFSTEYNLDYFENKAIPRYALIIKGAKLSKESERRILEYFRKEVKGKHHGTLYIPVPASAGSNVEVNLQAIENKIQDSSFDKYRSSNRTSIAMVHRVPVSKLGIGGSLATAREDDKTFKFLVCGPMQRYVEKKFNKVVREFTDMYAFAFEEYDIVDVETRSRIRDRDIRNGTRNANEVRQQDLGMYPKKGGEGFVSLADESEAKAKLAMAQATRASEKEVPSHKNQEGAGRGRPAESTGDGGNPTPVQERPEGKGTAFSAEDKGKVVGG